MDTQKVGKVLRDLFQFSPRIMMFGVLLSATSAVAGQQPLGLPQCQGPNGPLPFINEQVLKWKKETPNQWQGRALVSGQVERLLLKRATHTHVKVRIGTGPKDTIEVVYNNAFGDLPRIQAGMITEVCGDYITARAKAGPYPPSPEGAIIHWVHINTRGSGHEDGYFRIDGVVYGNRPSEVGGRHFNFMNWFVSPADVLDPAFQQ